MNKLTLIKRFLKRYKKETAIISGLFVLVVIIGVTCAFNATKDVKLVLDENKATAADAIKTEVINAQLQKSVEEVLQDQGYPVSEEYTISVDPDKKVKDVDTVTVKKNAVGQIKVDGKTVDYKSAAETVGDLLSDNNVQYDDDDIVTPAPSTALTTDVSNVTITRIEVKEEAGERDIPFESEEKENAELEEGTRNVVTQGVVGKADFVDKVTYQDGVEVKRENISTNTKVEPVKEVVEVGTKKAVPESLASSPSPSAGNATQAAGSDFDLICAIVAHEGGASYEGAMGVISCVMNRVDAGWGPDAVSVLTAPGQFASYLDGYYTQYLGNAPAAVQQAVTDCMEGGIRSHNFTSFRSYQTSGSVCIAGNWYF